ncbi:hypothetical protein [Pseudohongiella acticola]|mgnify:CR=1 FL=1|jgi:hypothetical protein|uniref:hypothetical protein n=1 Tax=Pseudohongiella acticola TaxID=1524254 RepID=UPI0030EB3BAE
MITRYHLTALISGLTLLLSVPVSSQVFPRGNGLSLSGVNQFDLYVQLSDWQDINADQTEFRRQALEALATRLASIGITRRSASRDYLLCNVRATQSNGLVAYTTTPEYWNLRSTDVHTLLWQNEAIAIVDQAEFSTELVASACADHIMAEWSKWNPAT